MNNKPLLVDKYESLKRVLADAMLQAKSGKGKERHADGEAFEDQKICVINRWLYGSPVAGPLFQVVKKTIESSRLGYDAAIRELYGAINYAAAGIKLLEELRDSEKSHKEPDWAANTEVRLLCHNKEGEEIWAFLPDGSPVKNVPDEFAVFEYPLCEDCYHMKLAPNEMPCKKCIDKPFKPHFTMSLPVYNKPPMPV